MQDHLWWIFAVCAVPLLIVASCVGSGGTFGQRCAKVYEGPAFERCVMRLNEGGPLYEENIGYRP